MVFVLSSLSPAGPGTVASGCDVGGGDGAAGKVAFVLVFVSFFFSPDGQGVLVPGLDGVVGVGVCSEGEALFPALLKSVGVVNVTRVVVVAVGAGGFVAGGVGRELGTGLAGTLPSVGIGIYAGDATTKTDIQVTRKVNKMNLLSMVRAVQHVRIQIEGRKFRNQD